MVNDYSKLRNEYKKRKLNKEDLRANPLEQFKLWLDEAINSNVEEPTAMTLATVDKESHPSARIVLLKFVNENGFVFFTNYNSKKGQELSNKPNAALVFFWSELERQVRVKGKVEKLDEAISDEYFQSRPKESRISAIISPQSKPIPNREFLENRVKEFIKKKSEIVRPPHWGGFILIPSEIEFWQGRENRLHDRFLYEREKNGWKISRLAP